MAVKTAVHVNQTVRRRRAQPYSRLGRRKIRPRVGSFIPWGIKVQIFKRQRERQSLYTFSPVTSAKLRCHLAIVAVSSFAGLAFQPLGLERTLVKKTRRGRENKKRAQTGTSGRTWRSLAARRDDRKCRLQARRRLSFLRGAARKDNGIGILCR